MQEFTEFGEMADIHKYLKKAQALDAKLQAAADKVRELRDLWEKKIMVALVCPLTDPANG